MVFRKESLVELRQGVKIEDFLKKNNKIPYANSSWWKWENGKMTPSADVLGFLAKHFNKGISFFYQKT